MPGEPGFIVGLSGLEPLASALSAQRSNHLSYRPLTVCQTTCYGRLSRRPQQLKSDSKVYLPLAASTPFEAKRFHAL